eukprot:TRINITY_DN547_c0_g1_i2.p3 TRINITY_DN547_c0_g1~~TRINITY_DN547_c0_g1_i2.p3  ORF type:complete len:177 (-),score=43.55 TRINITY_DN547_c0_g1_i2:1025-1486(-)
MTGNGSGGGSGDGPSGSGGGGDDASRALPHVTADGFTLRRLAAADFGSNYMALLGQLTRAPPVTQAAFEAFVAAADADDAGHLVLVAQAPLPPGVGAGLAPPPPPRRPSLPQRPRCSSSASSCAAARPRATWRMWLSTRAFGAPASAGGWWPR